MPAHLLTDDDFRILFSRNQDQLLKRCHRLTASPEEAEDLCQEAIAKAWAKRETFEGTGTFLAWLSEFARNTNRNDRRKKREMLTTEGVIDPESPGYLVLSQLTSEERAHVVQDSVKACLADTDQDIAWARYGENWSIKEITAAFGIEGASGARGAMQRINRKLRCELEARLAELGHGTSFVRTRS